MTAPFYSQPRGRPRKDSLWCTRTGRWVIHGARFQRKRKVYFPKTGPWYAAFCSDRTSDTFASDSEERARNKQAEEERHAEQERREEAERRAEAERREVLEAPRRYAQLFGGEGRAPVYYFDTFGSFQELGKEKEAKGIATAKRMVEVEVEEWVWGPSLEYQLEEGESELVKVKKWVWKEFV